MDTATTVRYQAGYIVVVAFVIIVSQVNYQGNGQPSATLLRQKIKPRSLCPGESVFYECIGSNGSIMDLYSPPFVNESRSLTVLARDPVQTFVMAPNLAATIVLVNSNGSSSFMGRLTLYISDKQREGEFSVYCRVSTTDGISTTDSTTFSVLGIPNPATNYSYVQVQNQCEETAQIPVNISWNFPENAQELILQIKNMNYNNTIRSLENSVTVWLPNGTYLVTLCTVNNCGKFCPVDYREMAIICNPQLETSIDVALTVAATLAGIFGGLFLIILLGVFIWILCIRVPEEKNMHKLNNKATSSFGEQV